MSSVELIYDLDCPNYKKAREQLLKAFAEAGYAPKWQEWDRKSPESPDYVRVCGSPTILVDGRDVSGTIRTSPDSCRLYENDKGHFQRFPRVDDIVSALKRSQGSQQKGSWKRFLALLPVIGTALMPKLICPACWPAYAGLLSAFGLGFINYTPPLLPLTAVFLAIVLGSLGFRASRRRGYYPLIAGVFASTVLLIGKFVFDSNAVMYGGLALLIAACLWNSWPIKKEEACPSCSSQPKGGYQHETEEKN